MRGDDHRCEWRERAEGLQVQLDRANATIATLIQKLTAVESTVEKLQRHAFGQHSEKMPPVAEAIRDPAKAEAARIVALRTRRENIEKRRQLSTRKIEHKVREDQKTCPKCGGHDFSRLGGGDVTELYDLVPAKVERQLHVQEKLRCRCGETIITADPPAKVYDKARFGPTFIAQVVVSKCADSLPLYRQAKAYRRAGVQVDDSTLGQLFHRAAEATKPLSKRLLQLVSEKEIVQADETTQRVQAKGKTRTAWLWSFIGRDEAEKEIISYVFSRSRSGKTPLRVLGDTLGKLVADAYSGTTRSRSPAGATAQVASLICVGNSSRPSPPRQSSRRSRWSTSSTSTGSSAPRSTPTCSAPPSTCRCARLRAPSSWRPSRRGSISRRLSSSRKARLARPSATRSASGMR